MLVSDYVISRIMLVLECDFKDNVSFRSCDFKDNVSFRLYDFKDNVSFRM